MPLINKRLLQKTLNENHHQLMSSQKILDHLKTKVYDRIQAKTFKKEEAEKPVILPRLFELLGYSHPENFEFEFTNQSRSADITLGVEFEGVRQPEVMVEWKGIDTTSLDKGKAGETPVSQMSDYMSKTNANFGIVSNFREFRLYSKQKGQTEFYQVYLEDIINNTNKLEEFVFLFRKTTLLKGENKQSLLETLINQSEAEQEQVTKDFYNDYKQRRLNLFGHLVENNPVAEKFISPLLQNENQNDDLKIVATARKIFLLEKSQKILDRLIFIMFCEDGFLLPNNILKDTHTLAKNSRSRSETKIWEEVKYLFEDIDKGRYDVNPQINAFNGGFFAEDVELNSLIIKDEIWADLIKLAEYDFESDLNVNILGHIFEQSISDIEELKSEIERNSPLEGWQTKSDGVDLKPKTSKRKKDGIYYTPEYITDYIVSETIGNWLNDQKVPLVRGQAEGLGVVVGNPLESIKVLDPAGGSGAFPNQVHNYLTKKHEAKFKELSKDQNDLFNQVQIDKSILQNNIFTVDLQPESVEIAKLSLWLKTAKKDQKLNNLDSNIKCGNSLIDDPKIAGESAFDWNQEFPEVMASGGFDVIVGNPPWVFTRGQKYEAKMKSYFEEYLISRGVIQEKKGKNVQSGKLNLYTWFIIRSIELLKNGGVLGFIIPNGILRTTTYDLVRKHLLDKAKILQIVDLGDGIFEGVTASSVILIIEKCENIDQRNANQTKIIFDILNLKEKRYQTHTIEQSLFYDNPSYTFNVLSNNTDVEISQKMKQNSVFLGEQCKYIIEGIVGSLDRDVSDIKLDDRYKSLVIGRDIGRYEHTPSGQYIRYDKNLLHRARPEEVFTENKILVQRISGGDLPVKAYLDRKQYYAFASLNAIQLKDDSIYSLEFILACLNSRILNWYYAINFSNKSTLTVNISKTFLEKLPIPIATPEQQAQIAELVDQIMNLKKEMQDYLKNTFILLQAELGGQKITLNKKLEKFWTLDFAEFLGELTKQKIQISHPQKRNLITSFETDKKKILELEQQVEKVDGEIEGLVRGLYGVK